MFEGEAGPPCWPGCGAKGACFGLDLGFFGRCFSETFEGEAGPP